MSKLRGGVEHTIVSTNSAISTKPCIYYGCLVVNNTTAGVQVKVFDAKATAQGNLTDVVTIASGTNANARSTFPAGIVMHSGIFISAIIATTVADSIIVYYGGV